MVAETLLGSVQFPGLKSRFSSMQSSYFNYPAAAAAASAAAGAGHPVRPPPPQPPPPATVSSAGEPYPTSPIDLPPGSLHSDMFNQRKQREFIPDNKKDDSYWDRRRRNNEAAKRSREKRRLTDMVLESRVCDLTKENYLMRAQLAAIRDKFGIVGENLINREQVLAQVPAMDQILSFTKRHQTLGGAAAHMLPLTGGGAALAAAAAAAASAPSTAGSVQFESAGSPPVLAQHHQQKYQQQQQQQLQQQQQVSAALLYRQHSLRELRQPENSKMMAHDYSRPRSAEPPPQLHSINLSKPLVTQPIVASVDATSGGSSTGALAAVGGDPSVSVLPLKLRHKTLMCEREAATASLLTLNQLGLKQPKEEPQDSLAGSETSSGDERDSGLSDRSASSDGTDEPARKRARSDAGGNAAMTSSSPHPAAALVEQIVVATTGGGDGTATAPANGQIRCELERLAKEVASLKSMLNQCETGPPARESV